MPVNQIYYEFKTFLFLLISLLISSCQQGEVKEKPVVPNEFVSAYTSGQILSNSTVRIVLNLPEEFAKISNQDLPKDVFKLKPHIAGRTYWANQFMLMFEPETPFPNGVKFEATVDLEKILDIKNDEAKQFQFYFEVIPLEFSLEVNEIQPYNHNKPKWNYIRGTIKASDIITEQSIYHYILAKQGEKSLTITKKETSTEKVYRFQIDSVFRGEKQSAINIQWISDEKAYGFDDKGLWTLEVPSVNRFKFTQARVIDKPDQYVQLDFSDPLNPDQDLNGLIYFTDKLSFTYTIENNLVKLYPKEHLVGDKSIIVKKQIKNYRNKQLENDIVQKIHFGQLKPEVRFIGDGTIMPGSNNWLLPFEAVNLKTVDVIIKKIYANNVRQFLQLNSLSGDYQLYRVGEQIHREKVEIKSDNVIGSSKWIPYALDLSKMIEAEPGAIYRVQLRFDKSYSLYDCNDKAKEQQNEQYENYYEDNSYSWSERDNPCSNSYYNYRRFCEKNVMASDIGITVKKDGDKLLVYTNMITDTEPMAGVKLRVYNYLQQEIGKGTSGKNGTAIIEYEGSPHLLIAEKNGQYAYQRIDGSSSLSYSKFDTRGVNSNKAIKGFIYGDRGVWRPGDTLFLTLVLDDRENPLPENHPVTLQLRNPKGKEVAKQTLLKGLNGFYTFKIPTSQEALTGFWNANISVGGASFYKRLRIETIKPNRLKIDLETVESLLTAGDNKATMRVKWLHGGKASGLKADVNATIRPQKTKFKNYESFNFDDPARYFTSEEYTVFDGELNEQGIADINFDMPSVSWAPGMLKVNLTTQVYEHGGDFSINQKVMNFAPFDTYIGVKGPDSKPGSHYLEVDKEHVFEVVTVDKTGNPISVENLEYEVYELNWSWWYGSRSRSLASYISRNYDRRVLSGKVSTKNGKGSFKVQIDYPSWGWYYIKVKHEDQSHETGLKIYLDWPSWYSRENRKAPGGMSLLSLTTDKEKYNIGETVKVSVPTPANARLLVSLEKGNRQISSWQQEADGEETVISFEASADMTPNIYLYVSVLQPHEQTINDLPIRMYGVIPVMIEDANTVLHPELHLPKTVRPDEKYKIKVTEKNKKAMTYTIAVVDEGLLDITNFKTPYPHKYFYQKEALAVRTWDCYDDVLGAFGGRMEKVFAIGGDMEEDEVESNKKKANRFKPVVSFLGPFELKEGEINEHELEITNYIGSVKCMLIAGKDGAYGNTEKTLTVKQPLMVLGTLPRVLCPGDLLKLPVSVFVMDENIKNIKIEVEANDFFILQKDSKQQNINKVGEHLAYFDLEVAQNQGIGKLKIKVSSGQETAYHEIEIDVRNPNPRVYDITHHMLKPNEEWTFNPEFTGINGTNEMNLVVSGIPPVNLEKRIRYLIRYPYGCIEQTTSSVFPQLYLTQLVNMSSKGKEDIERRIKSGIKRISERFQLLSGGFAYWPGNRKISDWGTNYAGHFLLLAKEKGYYVSPLVLNSWIRYQKNASSSWKYDKYKSVNQAYRLYTLALAGEPDLSAMNRLREDKWRYSTSSSLLAAAYALVGKNEVAKRLVDDISYDIPVDAGKYWHYNYGSGERDQAIIMSTYLLLGEMDKAVPIFKHIAEKLKSRHWMSTQTTAFTLYAVAQFIEGSKSNEEYNFTYTWNNIVSDEIRGSSSIYSYNFEVARKNQLTVVNKSDNNMFVTFTGSGIPAVGHMPEKQENIKVTVQYYDMNDNLIDVTNITHGTDFYARVTIKNPGTFGHLQNVALSRIFPAGWEIINTRMVDLGAELKSSHSDYIDYRDDRVNTFFSISSGTKKQFIVLLNAAYQGKFYMPPVQCGAMYNNEVSAIVGGGWVKVTK